jgi:hypothetical protein
LVWEGCEGELQNDRELLGYMFSTYVKTSNVHIKYT